MSLTRIRAIFLQEWFITKRSLEVIMDTVVFALIEVLAFGFVSVFLTKVDVLAGKYLLMGMIFWEVMRIPQYSISVGALWNVWSRNLSNMFIAPLSAAEYLVSQMLSGLVKSTVIFLIMAGVANSVFHFNIFVLGIPKLALLMLNLIIFGWSVGIIILGFIFKYGTRIQAIGWGAVYLLQPLSAVFFPLSILPQPLQKLALCLPSTYIFESARAGFTQSAIPWQTLAFSFCLNILYFALSVLLFKIMFAQSKASGQFARNEQ